MKPHLLLALSVALGVCAPHEVRAQATDPELTDASKRVYLEAVAAANKSDWALCRTKAIGVWQQVKSATVAGMLGICEAELGMNKEAAEHLDFFLLKQTKAPPDEVKQAKERFDKVKQLVATVIVVPTPSDAEVSVAGVTIGSGTQKIYVVPGDVTVAASKLGQSRSRSLTVIAGREERVEIEVPTVGDGGGGAGAGGGAGGAGGAGAGGAAGGVGAGGAGGAGGGDTVPSPAWPAVVLGVSGGAGLVLGAVGLGVGLGAQADAETYTCTGGGDTCATEAVDATDLYNTMIPMAGVGFAVGGAALIGMVVYLATAESGDPAVGFYPFVSPSSSGGSFVLTF